MKTGVVVFPGSNCDHDTYHVLKHVVGTDARFIWHGDAHLHDCDVIVLPGGFSYGDYLRTGFAIGGSSSSAARWISEPSAPTWPSPAPTSLGKCFACP